MKTTVKVTSHEILNCDQNDNENCAIALSLLREGHINVEVDPDIIKIDGTIYECSKAIEKWQLELMKTRNVAPITIIIDSKKFTVKKQGWFNSLFS